MSNKHIIVVILIVLLLFAVPAWPYNRGWRWGYYPSGLVAVVLIILLILLLLGRL